MHGVAQRFLLALDTQCGDDDFVELVAGRSQYDAQCIPAAEGHGLRGVAHVGDRQAGIRFHIDGEFAIQISDDTVLRAFFKNAGTDDGFARFVENNADNGLRLLLCLCRFG